MYSKCTGEVSSLIIAYFLILDKLASVFRYLNYGLAAISKIIVFLIFKVAINNNNKESN